MTELVVFGRGCTAGRQHPCPMSRVSTQAAPDGNGLPVRQSITAWDEIGGWGHWLDGFNLISLVNFRFFFWESTSNNGLGMSYCPEYGVEEQYGICALLFISVTALNKRSHDMPPGVVWLAVTSWLKIFLLWHHRWACPPRCVTDRWATFATVLWVGWWTDLSSTHLVGHAHLWCHNRHSIFKRLVMANHTTPGCLSWDLKSLKSNL